MLNFCIVTESVRDIFLTNRNTYRVEVRESFLRDVWVEATSKREARKRARNPKNWVDAEQDLGTLTIAATKSAVELDNEYDPSLSNWD